MTNIKVNFNKIIGKIKPVHGVGQAPTHNLNTHNFHYLTEAGIPYSRLHDFLIMTAHCNPVDIPGMFPDFNKDPKDPESYDFAFADVIVKGLIDAGVEPFWRLGVTFENFTAIKGYHVFPPKNPQKWAEICEGVIRHYTEGFANGYHYNIEHWEIWNEPDNYETYPENNGWAGTKEEYYELYDVTSRHLKKCFPHLKIGGYSSCGFYALTEKANNSGNCSPRHEYFIEFFNGFLDYIKAHGSPLDFFSWHSYPDNPEYLRTYARYARQRLDDAGYTNTTTSFNEWNCQPQLRGTVKHAALNAAILLICQDEPIDTAMFYDARMGVSMYGGMFNPLTQRPFPTYYSFMAFNELYRLKNECQVEKEDNDGIYACAARDGRHGAIMIVNTTDEKEDLNLTFEGQIFECKVIDEDRNLSPIGRKIPSSIPAGTVILINIEFD